MMFVVRHHSGNTDVLCRIIHGSLDLPKNVHIQRLYPKQLGVEQMMNKGNLAIQDTHSFS